MLNTSRTLQRRLRYPPTSAGPRNPGSGVRWSSTSCLRRKGADNRAEAERGRAYHHASGRSHPERLNSSGTCSDLPIERRWTEKLGMPAAGTEWTSG